ncbi:MAG: hypothetical protein J7L55_04055 [Desulfurococcales archaeon]|nr:hypothetical protein [Desulfurococcales archaeon]
MDELDKLLEIEEEPEAPRSDDGRIEELRKELANQREQIASLMEGYSKTVEAIEGLKGIISEFAGLLEQRANQQTNRDEGGGGLAGVLQNLAPLAQLVQAGMASGPPQENQDMATLQNLLRMFKLFTDMQKEMVRSISEMRKYLTSSGGHVAEGEG